MADKPSKDFITDAMIERPVSFRYRRGRYSIFPLSLGKINLCVRLIDDLGLDTAKTKGELLEKSLEASKSRRDACLRLVAYVSLPGSDCLDETKVTARIRRFRRMRAKDLATILYLFLSMDNTKEIMTEYGMDKEDERLSRVIKAKREHDDGSSLSFGGKSIWGTLIDSACERYGWTYQYVLWGISFSALQLMLSDHVKTVTLTKEEGKAAHASGKGQTIRADDKEALKAFIKNHNWG